MTTNQFPPLPPMPPVPQHRDLDPEWSKPPAVRPKLYQRKWFAPIAAAVALFVGVSIGVGSADNAAPSAAKSPAAAPVVVPKVEVKTVEVEKTPQSCKVALKYADAGFGNAKDAFDIVARAFDAVSTFDADALSAEVDKLSTLQPKLAANITKYTTARDECQAAG